MNAFVLDDFESRTEPARQGTVAGAGAGKQAGGVVGPKLTRIAELIRASDARAVAADPAREAETRALSRKRLAVGLGCGVEDLEDITSDYGEQEWEQLVLDERVRLGIDSTAMRDATWDRLEGATLRKLLMLVEADKVRDSMELLAIAKAANAAARNQSRGGKTRDAGAGQGNTAQQQFNVGIGIMAGGQYAAGDPANGVLPAGDLGTIQLRLSHRVQSQLHPPSTGEGGETVEEPATVDSGRVLDSLEMLDLKSIQAVGEESEQES